MFVETNTNHLVVPNLADNGFDEQESKRCVDDKEEEESDDKRNSKKGISVERLHSMKCLPRDHGNKHDL